MVGIIDTCVKCGSRFCRGIYPQKRCDFCSPHKIFTAKNNKKVK